MAETVLALVENAGKAQQFIDAALTLAEFRQAHLIVELLAEIPLLAPETAPFGAFYALADEVEQRADVTRDVLQRRMPAGASVEVVSQVDGSAFLPGDLRRAAPLADLVMVGPATGWTNDRLRRLVVETMILSAGAPVLLLPPGRSVRKVDHAVIGWKRGAPGIRAVRELARLAAPGAQIDVLHVAEDGDPEAPSDDVKALLERQGFAVAVHAAGYDEPVAERLQSFALDRGADLLAIGGYATSRAREIVFGGVTRTMIDEPRVPVLLAH